jgi:DtxR family transcriptional regulator, Mn-dependent transcriptional regulator
MLLWILGSVGLAAAAAFALRGPVTRQRTRNRRADLEDVLKHIFTRRHEGREASMESVAGHLRISPRRAIRLCTDLESQGMAESDSGTLRLTPKGEDWAREVVRAHRLWETYLANEARMSMRDVHGPAEREEHRLVADREVEALDARLGHPRSDPHGDPIPRIAGDAVLSPARCLTGWPVGTPAEVVHVEDEPEALFEQILKGGLAPGTVVMPIETSADRIVLSEGSRVFELSRLAAGSVQVRAVSEEYAQRSQWVRLSDLNTGEAGEVMLLDPALRGFTRRRLLDLGLTARAKVQAALGNAFGDPKAYRVRGTTIALRNDQASRVWVKRSA